MKRQLFAGVGASVRLILRRERLALPVWIFVTALLSVASAASFAKLYPAHSALAAYATETAGNPTVVALLGPVYAPTLGGLVAWRWTVQGAFLISLMSLLLVVAHTRADEEMGRRELLGATPSARHAALTATLIVVLTANLAMAATAALGMIALGLPVAGAVVLSLSVAGVGWSVAGLAAVAAQASETAAGARGAAGAAGAVLYVMRVIGDAAPPSDHLSWLDWATPFGWARLSRPFAQERWWVLLLFVLATASLFAVAYVVNLKRDLGAGLLRPRAGPPAAAGSFRNTWALAWRLHRGALWAWTISLGLTGAVFGFVARTVADLLAANADLLSFFTRIGGSSAPSDVVFHIYYLTFGPIIALYAIQAVQKLKVEESGGRAEPILATPTPRARWVASHVVYAVFGPVLILTTLGVCAGLAYGLGGGQIGTAIGRSLLGAFVYLPAIWIVAGVAMLQYGLAPRLTGVSWGFWLACGLVDFLGSESQLIPRGLYRLSPFAHVPSVLLGAPAPPEPLLAMVAIAGGLLWSGGAAFRRRDITA